MIDLPSRLYELWDWFSALWAWDYGDPKQLSDLIRKNDGVIPAEFADAIADIVSGSRKPNKKAAAKLLIPACEFGKLSGSLLLMSNLAGALRKRADYGSEKRGVAAIAEFKKLKPIDVVRHLELFMSKSKESASDHFEVTYETVERLMREANKRIEKWPVV
ncbi:MAG: hypothetical protein PHV02_07725 [Rhodocyclaceae bacterium]|nr:hypothetical protein [Rhodocyclaceae bacterium]